MPCSGASGVRNGVATRELNEDVGLRFDGFPIDQCGLIAPSLNRCDHAGKQVRGTIDGPDGLDLAVFGDSGMDANVLT